MEEILVHTGQHFDANMSDVFFEELAIPAPDYNLEVAGGGHGAMTGRMLERVEDVIQKERPDQVLVYGDTNSTLAGALAAVKLHVQVAHVEAGLRSFNRAMPEEINRVLTDHASDLLFTPTDAATHNLAAEGIPPERVEQVGDVMYDAALFYRDRAEKRSDVLPRFDLDRGQYILATVHRQENTDNSRRLESIFRGLAEAAQDRAAVLPLHPRTRARLEAAGLMGLLHDLKLLPPVGYLGMVQLGRHAALIVTDSGSVQKETYFHGVACLTLREETEWMELVELGWNRLVVPGLRDIAEVFSAAMDVNGRAGSPYGEGDPADWSVELAIFASVEF
jgi:UDP-GlcNAc3NAcA epimerase